MKQIEGKMARIESLVRPNIRALKPYSSARDEFKHAPETTGPLIFLDANENSLGSPLSEDLSRYPDPNQGDLKKRIAVRENLHPDQIFVGNGSDEAIDLLLRAFCIPGQDQVVVLPPTYGMYKVLADLHDIAIRQAPLLPDFSPDAMAVRAATAANPKILFLCSPNNPSGNHLPENFIREMLGEFPGLVVVDEAYCEFSSRPSLTGWLEEFPNLVVLKTLSKAWGLAGLRVGMAFANPYITGILNKIKYPYNLGTLTIRQACLALDQGGVTAARIALLLSERERLATRLKDLSCIVSVYPSDANFILVKTINADSIYSYLCEKGIIVRNRNKELHCENCLRITVGSIMENNKVIEALNAF